jgi:hypothetical protein
MAEGVLNLDREGLQAMALRIITLPFPFMGRLNSNIIVQAACFGFCQNSRRHNRSHVVDEWSGIVGPNGLPRRRNSVYL